MAEAYRAESKTLYERIGGEGGIALFVDSFYQRVLGDPELGQFFQHTSMERLRKMQRLFFTAALDGPATYSGRSLSEAHYGMGVRPRHLGLFVRHLFATLQALDIEEQDALDIVSRINTFVDEITGDASEDG